MSERKRPLAHESPEDSVAESRDERREASRTEAADADQRERASGAYELHIDAAPRDEAGWRSLRRALRHSRADDAGLRARVPGVVRRGARVDLLSVLERVRQAGHEASLRPRGASGSAE